MMRTATILALFCIAPMIANAAPQSDPNWPCQQIKVADLALASVWTGPPVDPHQSNWRDDPTVADLVQKIAPRREPIEQAQALIHDFAQQAGDRKQPRLLNLLAGVFSTLDTERVSVMAGLDRFGERQKELAAGLRADNEKLHTLQGDPSADPEAVQKMVQQVTWEAELFQDRRQAINYACEAQSKIEQRLFGLARQIEQEIE